MIECFSVSRVVRFWLPILFENLDLWHEVHYVDCNIDN